MNNINWKTVRILALLKVNIDSHIYYKILLYFLRHDGSIVIEPMIYVSFLVKYNLNDIYATN